MFINMMNIILTRSQKSSSSACAAAIVDAGVNVTRLVVPGCTVSGVRSSFRTAGRCRNEPLTLPFPLFLFGGFNQQSSDLCFCHNL
jgi:hypothetical protein